MSTLSAGQHKQLLAAIVDYLQDLQASAPAGVVADSLELNNALRSLRGAASLSDASALQQHAIAPHTLASIFSGAGIPAPKAAAAPQVSSDFEAKFAKYVAVLKERSYFGNATEGTPEYQVLLDKARTKLLERTEGAASSGAGQAAAGSSTPSAPVKEVSEAERIKAEELKTQGNAKMTEKNYEEAIRLYGEAIAIVPNNAIYFANRAAAQSQLSNHEQAVADSKEAIAIDPKYIKAYSRLGLAYFALGKYQQAIEEGYEKALQLDPSSALIRDGLKAARAKLAEQGGASSSDAAAAPSAAPGNDGFASMMQNLMGSLGGGAGGAAPGGANGSPDLGSMLSNPQFMQMASQMAQSPGFQQMAQQLSSNPDLLNNLGGLFNRPPQ